jgi:hypothetical protein
VSCRRLASPARRSCGAAANAIENGDALDDVRRYIKAARVLLNMNQDQLAGAMGVGKDKLAVAERMQIVPSQAAADLLRPRPARSRAPAGRRKDGSEMSEPRHISDLPVYDPEWARPGLNCNDWLALRSPTEDPDFDPRPLVGRVVRVKHEAGMRIALQAIAPIVSPRFARVVALA